VRGLAFCVDEADRERRRGLLLGPPGRFAHRQSAECRHYVAASPADITTVDVEIGGLGTVETVTITD